MNRGGLALTVAAVLLCGSGPAAAQSAPAPGRLEVGGGLFWSGSSALGARAAEETASAGGTLALFTTATDLAPAAGADARLGFALTPMLEVEGSVDYSRPRLRSRITGDFEQAADLVATEPITEVIVQAGLVVPLRRWRLGRRGTPFLRGGGGYLRDLHDGRTVVETGRAYYLGGGLKLLLRARDRAAVKALGISIDARALWRTGGIVVDGRTRVSPVLGASLFARF